MSRGLKFRTGGAGLQEGPLGDCAFSPDGQLVAVGGLDKHGIVVVQASSGMRVGATPEPSTLVDHVRWGDDGYVRYADSNYIYSVRVGEWNSVDRREFDGLVWVSLSNGPEFLVVEEDDATVWREGERLWEFSSGDVAELTDLYLSPDGREVFFREGGSLNCVNLESGSRSDLFKAEGPVLGQLALSPGNRFLALADEPARILRFQDLEERERVDISEVLDGYILGAFSNDGETFGAVQSEGDVSIFSVEDWRVVASGREYSGFPAGFDINGKLARGVAVLDDQLVLFSW